MRWITLLILLMLAPALGQTTKPTTAPSASDTPPSADQLLNQMLKPADNDKAAAIEPTASGSSVPMASAAGTGRLLREGIDIIVDRVGRVQKAADGVDEDFIFESDGKAMHDPPMGILPNLKLMQMENALTTANRDLRFRVTGTITEYRGKNYILLEKVVVVQDKDQEF